MKILIYALLFSAVGIVLGFCMLSAEKRIAVLEFQLQAHRVALGAVAVKFEESERELRLSREDRQSLKEALDGAMDDLIYAEALRQAFEAEYLWEQERRRLAEAAVEQDYRKRSL